MKCPANRMVRRSTSNFGTVPKLSLLGAFCIRATYEDFKTIVSCEDYLRSFSNQTTRLSPCSNHLFSAISILSKLSKASALNR